MTTRKKMIAALLLAAASVAQAQVPTPISFAYGSTSGIMVATSNSPAGYLTGEMSFLSDQGLSFSGYCVELGQSYAEVGTNQVYTLGSFTAAQSSLLQALYSSTYASVSSTTQKAAFQTAIWEIVSEPAGSALDLSAGSFKFNSLGTDVAANQGFNTLASSYLANALNYSGPAQFQLQKLVNGTYQDYVVATPVPEPAPYAMLLAGLGAVGFIARRRAR